MRYLFEKIKYSEFYKKYIKGLKVTKGLRLIRDLLVRIKKKLHGWMNPKEQVADLLETLNQYMTQEAVETIQSDETIDIIIPIYNGYDYLVRLFEDLTKTSMNCRYILVDDKSPDERVRALEAEFVAKHENAILLENDKNYGFVNTVNHGLKEAKGHVALINTDTELPEGWLERLMAPILRDETVGTTTPYTNSGTIFSFPNFCYNNEIYLGMDVDHIDGYFQRIKPRYVDAPTGVGFCMGMNRKAIDEIGNLDYETFDRGFGEENDWCQRAKKHGYKNVQVENLYVYHKHGGSFLSDEKQQLIASHLDKLNKRYPTYDYQVQKYIAKDPNQKVRQLIQMLIDTQEKESILFFDHNMGGGATSYMNMQIRKMVGDGKCVSTIRFLTMENKFEFTFYNNQGQQKYVFTGFDRILEIGQWLHFNQIYINELVTYPELWKVHDTIVKLKVQQESELIMLFHDFFAICPSINLLDKGKAFCQDATGEKCEECYQRNEYQKHYQCPTRAEWVLNWKKFLMECTEVRCFSEDTFNRVEKVYQDGLKLTLVPHQVNYVFPIHKEHRTTDTLNIGLLGVLAIHKGGEVVRQLLDEIEEKNLNINIRLIGWTDGVDLQKYSHFSATGRYKAEQLPQLVYENDIDMFLIASIWPETFSYTAQEIINMGMPLASFDFGAPAERIAKYEKGLVLDRNSSSATILEEIQKFVAEKELMQPKVSYKRNIYVAEYISFSSRYRLEHLQEELLYQGMLGDFYEAKKLPKEVNWSEVGAVIVYRSRYRGKLKKFLDEAKAHGVQIIYDIDDLIFDTSQMDYTPDFDREVYGNFQQYSDEIRECMNQADKIMVSTNTLRDAVIHAFGESKQVFVNRNVASAEMLILSARAREYKHSNGNKVVIGYFSGSNTHNEDFELISKPLLEVMKAHSNVQLKVVGCMELPEEYHKLEEQITPIEFMDWEELPEEIASVDINLMPLIHTYFHQCKSENKWMEAGLVEVATIGSYNEEIAGATHPGEDVLLCDGEQEWMNALEALVTDINQRNRIAQNAYKETTQYKTTLYKNPQLLEFIREK